MCLLWESLATRNVDLLSQALERRHNLVGGCAWVNYVRSHYDIGWTFADEGTWCYSSYERDLKFEARAEAVCRSCVYVDAIELGKEGGQHRKFLNAFFVNRHPGSFARGVPFQDNPKTVSLARKRKSHDAELIQVSLTFPREIAGSPGRALR